MADPAALNPQPRTWVEIAADPDVQSLKAEEYDYVRRQFFAKHIAPTLDADEIDSSWSYFDSKTSRGEGGDLGAAARRLDSALPGGDTIEAIAPRGIMGKAAAPPAPDWAEQQDARERAEYGEELRRQDATLERAIKPEPLTAGVAPKIEPQFDPEGSGYDEATARAAGLAPDETGHWPSREPKTGIILKGRQHPTWNLTEEGERAAGHIISKDASGRYVSQPAPPPTTAPQLPPDPERTAIEGLIGQAEQDAARIMPDLTVESDGVTVTGPSEGSLVVGKLAPPQGTPEYEQWKASLSTKDRAAIEADERAFGLGQEKTPAELSPGHFLRRPSPPEDPKAPLSESIASLWDRFSLSVTALGPQTGYAVTESNLQALRDRVADMTKRVATRGAAGGLGMDTLRYELESAKKELAAKEAGLTAETQDWKRQVDEFARARAEVTPKNESFVGEVLGTMAESSPAILAGLLTLAITRNPALAAEVGGVTGGTQEGVTAYAEARQANAPVSRAQATGIINGLLERFGDALQIKALSKAGKDMLSRLLSGYVAVVPVQTATEGLQAANEALQYNQNMTVAEVMHRMAVAAGAATATTTIAAPAFQAIQPSEPGAPAPPAAGLPPQGGAGAAPAPARPQPPAAPPGAAPREPTLGTVPEVAPGVEPTLRTAPAIAPTVEPVLETAPEVPETGPTLKTVPDVEAPPKSDIEIAAEPLQSLFTGTDAQARAEAESVDAAAHEAATSPQNDKTASKEQILGGNAELGHTNISGLEISIENPAGSIRRDLKNDPPKWQTEMKSHYGYIRDSVGKDKDHVDVFVKPDTTTDYSGPVFVVDQKKADGRFDEHKVMIGFPDEATAKAGYLENYAKGWDGIKAITPMSMEGFKTWLREGDTTKEAGLLSQTMKGKLAPAAPKAETVLSGKDTQAPVGQDDAGGLPASGADYARGLGGQESAAAVPVDSRAVESEPLKAYKSADRAKLEARKLTRQGAPSKVVPHPTEQGKFAVVEREVKPRSESQKANDARLRQERNTVNPERDSLHTAIGKLGGMDRAKVKSEWDVGDDARPNSGVIGKPVLKREGGLTIDGMIEALAQYGYLKLDENGKADMNEVAKATAIIGDDAIQAIKDRVWDEAGNLHPRVYANALRKVIDEEVRRTQSAKPGASPPRGGQPDNAPRPEVRTVGGESASRGQGSDQAGVQTAEVRIGGYPVAGLGDKSLAVAAKGAATAEQRQAAKDEITRRAAAVRPALDLAAPTEADLKAKESRAQDQTITDKATADRERDAFNLSAPPGAVTQRPENAATNQQELTPSKEGVPSSANPIATALRNAADAIEQSLNPEQRPAAREVVEPTPATSEPGKAGAAPGREGGVPEVERFSGQYKKGMTLFNAKREMKRLASEKPNLRWEVVPEPKHGPDRFDVVGYAQRAEQSRKRYDAASGELFDEISDAARAGTLEPQALNQDRADDVSPAEGLQEEVRAFSERLNQQYGAGKETRQGLPRVHVFPFEGRTGTALVFHSDLPLDKALGEALKETQALATKHGLPIAVSKAGITGDEMVAMQYLNDRGFRGYLAHSDDKFVPPSFDSVSDRNRILSVWTPESYAGPEPRFARSQAPQTEGLSLSAFRSALASAFGETSATRLLDSGILNPIADQSELPARVVPFLRIGDQVFGFYDPRTDKAYAVLSNLTPEDVRGLALHEVGVHYGLKKMLGDKQYKQVMKRLDVMVRAGHKAANEARAAAEANVAHPSQIEEETLAYLVQNHPRMNIVREIIAAIKAFLFREFGIGAKYLSDADMVMLARAAVQKAGVKARGTMDVLDVAFSRDGGDNIGVKNVIGHRFSGPVEFRITDGYSHDETFKAATFDEFRKQLNDALNRFAQWNLEHRGKSPIYRDMSYQIHINDPSGLYRSAKNKWVHVRKNENFVRISSSAIFRGGAERAWEGALKVAEHTMKLKMFLQYDVADLLKEEGLSGERKRPALYIIKNDDTQPPGPPSEGRGVSEEAPGASGVDDLSPRFSRAGQRAQVAPRWYSELARKVEALSMNAAPAEQWKATIAGLKNKGVKADEIEWSGVNDWLAMQSGKVSKDAVLSFLRENGVKVEETELTSVDNRTYNNAAEREARLHEDSNAFWRDKVEDAIPPIKGVDRANLPWWAFEMVEPESTPARRDDAEAKASAVGLDDKQIELLKEYGMTRVRYLNAQRYTNTLKNDSKDGGRTKFETYTLHGGENYRELLLTLPDMSSFKELDNLTKRYDAGEVSEQDFLKQQAALMQKRRESFQSPHFDQPNILAHIRFNERADADGKRVLFIEEIQSDWAQKGKREGFVRPSNEIEKRAEAYVPGTGWRDISMRTLMDAGADADFINEWGQYVRGPKSLAGRIPSAPFVGKTEAWVSLAMKRMIRYAAENGFERVAWTTGDQQADRYDLSKQIQDLTYQKGGDGQFTLWAHVGRGDGRSDLLGTFPPEKLADVIGKEMAQKIIDGGGKPSGFYGEDKGKITFDNIDLKIGGEGMRAFYDKIVPNVANDVLKKLGGGHVDTTKIPGTGERTSEFSTALHPPRYAAKQPGFDLTPALREKAMQGMPLFSRAGQRQQPLPLPKWQSPDPTRLDTFIYEFQNKVVDLKRVQEEIEKAFGPIKDTRDAYLGEELYYGKVASQVEDFLAKEIKPLMTDMRARGVKIPEFEEFLHARHAEERNIQIAKVNPNMPDGGSGMTTLDAKKYLISLGPAKKRAFEALAKRVDAINTATRQWLVTTGLETAATVQAWEDAYKHYVPLHRDEAHPENAHPIGQGFSVRGSATKRATGSTATVTHILGHILAQREAALTRAAKNDVGLRLYNLAIHNPNTDFWMIDKPPTIRGVSPQTGLVFDYVDPTYKSRPDVLMLRVAGQDRSITFNAADPRAARLAESMKNIDIDDLHRTLWYIGKATRYFASINTQYNPVFGVFNGMRDVQAAALNLTNTPIKGEQAKVIFNAPSALRGIWRFERDKGSSHPWSILWEDFKRRGGQTGFRDLFRSAEDRAKKLEKELKALDRGSVGRGAHALLDFLDDYNLAIENSVRLSAYKAGLDAGLSKERAASVAKNLTVNFNRRGRTGRELGSLYAFFNASAQGTARMVQTLKGPAGKKIIFGGISLGVIQGLLSLAFDDDDWDEIPDFVKERSLVLPMPGGNYVAIPYPLGFNILPNIGRTMTELFLKKGEDAADQFGALLLATLEATNPIGGASNLVQQISPTVTDPLVQLYGNEDWNGKPIYRDNFSALDPTPGAARARPATSEVWKKPSQVINWMTGGTEWTPGFWSPTPEALRFVFETLTGGVGREITKTVELAESAVTGESVPRHRIPLFGRLYGETGGQEGIVSRYFENAKHLNELERELKGRMMSAKPGEGERIHDAFVEKHPEVNLAGGVDRIDQARQMINKARRHEKDVFADKAEAALLQRMDEFNQSVKEARAR